MVPQNAVCNCKRNYVFSDLDNRFSTAVDRNKCLEQIKIPISLCTGAPITELTSKVSSTVRTGCMMLCLVFRAQCSGASI